MLDLPFTAVEWVLPSDMLHTGTDTLTPAKWMMWDRSPLAKERSLAVSSCHTLHTCAAVYWNWVCWESLVLYPCQMDGVEALASAPCGVILP